ncbi:TetR/AcrR family transcriptional regulator [Nocardiopsis synnemataformans]|uniref:TetR/AcrR family transcriptional regulator n=1 Tax=Nocardiopsis synnemataformans TaxID=61305 RepID=UPI003EBB1DED
MTKTIATPAESGPRARTRRAILDAAVSVLVRDPAAPLVEIAKAADVGRSTLHRYFKDRPELYRAVLEHSQQAITEVVAGSAVGQGRADEALRQLITGLVNAGDRILFLFYGYRSEEDGDDQEKGSTDGSDDAIIRLIRRGQEEGTLTRDLDAEWIENALWSLVFAGCEEARNGKLPRHGVAATVIRTFEGGVVRGD